MWAVRDIASFSVFSLVNAGDVVSAERLINALWGENPPNSAPSMLHVRVSRSATHCATDEWIKTRASSHVTPATSYRSELTSWTPAGSSG